MASIKQQILLVLGLIKSAVLSSLFGIATHYVQKDSNSKVAKVSDRQAQNVSLGTVLIDLAALLDALV